jgi:GH15 family glucan-1,4-alpha-glucosidase
MSGRADGYAPIRDYAGLGDGRTVALVARDGRIDWWAVPTLDSPPVLAALLDPADGGFFDLAPTEDFEVTREYVEDSNVLATTFTTAGGAVRVTDALNVGVAGRLPWLELVRHIEGLSGRVPMRWRFEPGTRFGTARPWTRSEREATVLHVGDQHLALQAFDAGEPQIGAHSVAGEFTTDAGSTGLLVTVATDHEPVFLPSRDHVAARLLRTVEAWRVWCSEIDYDGPWVDDVRRSALALKLLLYAPSGAIAAAPTTSLPERIGGDRNYDYRFAWIRDASFTLDAMMRLGLTEEVHAAVSWILDTLTETAPDIHVFYKLDGRADQTESEIDAPGYRGSAPVRVGNGAAKQSQLGTFGDLFEMIWLYVGDGHIIDADTERLLISLADHCCDHWRQADAGIWELEEQRQYTISKIGCWVALDRAVRLAEADQVLCRHIDRWRNERDEIHRWVDEHCWSKRKNSYTQYAGSDDLDAAVLLMARNGFADGPRLESTIDAIQQELSCGPLLYRYTGMIGKEGAFVACSFWLAEALVQVGRVDEARDLISSLFEQANDVGLYAEEIDPDTGEFLGNFPQGLSHLAAINAVTTYAERVAQHDGTR